MSSPLLSYAYREHGSQKATANSLGELAGKEVIVSQNPLVASVVGFEGEGLEPFQSLEPAQEAREGEGTGTTD